MKILLINKFHYLRGGAERVYFATKKLLEANGHQVVCFSMRDERNEYSEQAKYFAPFVDFSLPDGSIGKGIRFLYNREAAKRLTQLLDEEKPDIAHIHNFAHQLTVSILSVLKKKNIPIVQTLHDYQLICPNYKLFTAGKVCERCRGDNYYNCILHKCVQNAALPSALAALDLYSQRLFHTYRENVNQFISPSLFLKDELERWGVKQPIEVINNFIDANDYEPRYGGDDYIVCASRFSEEKGVLDLLTAMKELPKIRLKLAGEGPEFEKIRLYIRDHLLTNVELVGWKSGVELFALIRNARFVVVPSRWYENYPMIVLEAMALGKPVMAAGIGGMTEMVMENETGWLYHPANTEELRAGIMNNFYDIDGLDKLGREARRSIEQFNSGARHYEKLMKCYEKVLNREVSVG